MRTRARMACTSAFLLLSYCASALPRTETSGYESQPQETEISRSNSFIGSPVNTASWIFLAELAPSPNYNASEFGWSSAVSGEAGVIGSIRDSDDTGAAYVFVKKSGTLTQVQQTARLTASDGQPGDSFGTSVSISGNTVVVGAREKAYVFVEPPTGWIDMTETAQLTASDGQPNDAFGGSVGISGNTVIVGASFETVGSNPEEGAAYIFVKPTGGWVNATQTAELTASDGVAFGEFGFSVGISGNTAAVAANSSNQAAASGAVYVFVEPSGGWADMTQTAKLTDRHDIGIGFSVTISGNTIATGSPFGSTGKGPRGAADVYVKPAKGWKSTINPTATLSASDGDIDDEFGFSVATTGSSVIAGAPYAHCLGVSCNQGVGDGIVYAFTEPTGGWINMTQTQELTPSDGMSEGFFGESVAASGPAVLVGANGTNTAYVYRYTSN
jgi:hypothetical protein